MTSRGPWTVSALFVAAFVLPALGLTMPTGLAAGGPRPPAPSVLVFAASSLKTALDDVMVECRRTTGVDIRASYAATSALTRQLEAGAPADIFISADLEWMDYAGAKKLIRAETRVDLLGNGIVLIAPATSTVSLTIARGMPIGAALGGGRLAVADPAVVPAGRYAKAALESLGVWPDVSNRIAPAENVRSALLLVSRGEAPLGIVYRTDAAADRRVRVLGAFPADMHPAIIYPAAITASARPEAPPVLACLGAPVARAIFERWGFDVPHGGRR